jgi:2-keto-4-pentenoate hydratase
MKTALAGPGVGVVGVADALVATAAVGCGFEVIDSRFDDFRFTLADAVADNTSAAGVVLEIEPGWLVLSGGITEAAPLLPGGRFVASFGRLGSVSVHGVE